MSDKTQPTDDSTGGMTMIDGVYVVVMLAAMILAPIAFFNGMAGTGAVLAIGAAVIAASLKWMPSKTRP